MNAIEYFGGLSDFMCELQWLTAGQIYARDLFIREFFAL